MTSRHIVSILSVLALAGCPSDDAGNPPVLWLALDGSEIKTRLIDHEPKPF